MILYFCVFSSEITRINLELGKFMMPIKSDAGYTIQSLKFFSLYSYCFVNTDCMHCMCDCLVKCYCHCSHTMQQDICNGTVSICLSRLSTAAAACVGFAAMGSAGRISIEQYLVDS